MRILSSLQLCLLQPLINEERDIRQSPYYAFILSASDKRGCPCSESQSPLTLPSYSKYDFPGASNIGKPGYLKEKWANILPLSMVKSMTQNREPGQVVQISLCCFVLIVFFLHFTVLISPSKVIDGWVYWRITGAIIFFIGILCCLWVFSIHVQFRGPRPNLFRFRSEKEEIYSPFLNIGIQMAPMREVRRAIFKTLTVEYEKILAASHSSINDSLPTYRFLISETVKKSLP
ncbi:hypothetical protein ACTXT7_008281 [Hymenolepis weldensis]